MPRTTVDEINELVERIDRFDEESREAQHTDTERAWELLRKASWVLCQAVKDLNAVSPVGRNYRAAHAALNGLIQRDNLRTCPYCTKDAWGAEEHDEGCPLRLAYVAMGDVDA